MPESLKLAALLALTACGSWSPSTPPAPTAPSRVASHAVAKPDAPQPLRAPSLAPIAAEPSPTGEENARRSLDARPGWQSGLEGYAPQLSRVFSVYQHGVDTELDARLMNELSARALFDAAVTETENLGPLEGELLACAVGVAYSETKAKAEWIFPIPLPLIVSGTTHADLRVTFGYGAFANEINKRDRKLALQLDGPEDSNTAWFTAPVVTLGTGDAVAVKLDDRGVFSDDADLGEIRGAYDGRLPLRLSNGNHSMLECRRVPANVRAQPLRLALQGIDHETARLDVWQAAGLDELLTYSRVNSRIEVAAALVGWSDPRIALRRKRLGQVHRRLLAERVAEAEKLQSTLPEPTKEIVVADKKLSARVASFACGAAAQTDPHVRPNKKRLCLMRLRLRNLADGDKDLGGGDCKLYGVWMDVLDRHGRRLFCSYLGAARPDGKREDWSLAVAPGDEVDVFFQILPLELRNRWPESFPPAFDGDLSKVRPVLLRTRSDAQLNNQRRRAWLRLE